MDDFLDTGCCVIQPGKCVDDQKAEKCIDDTDGLGGDIWASNKACLDVPQCVVAPPRNIPTLSQWGLIAMAVILAIVAFMVIRKRKVSE